MGVEVVGLQPPSEIQRLMQACNLFILPCRKAPDGDMDGVPVALMEAMASGRPVLTTPVSGIPELVDEKVGWMVPPNRPDLLAEAIDSALDPAQRLLRGQQGRHLLMERGFTLQSQVNGLLESWQKP